MFTSFFRDQIEKCWITGTPLEEASNIFVGSRRTRRKPSDAADRAGWRQAFEWLTIIVLMGGLRDDFLNHVKRAAHSCPLIRGRGSKSRRPQLSSKTTRVIVARGPTPSAKAALSTIPRCGVGATARATKEEEEGGEAVVVAAAVDRWSRR